MMQNSIIISLFQLLSVTTLLSPSSLVVHSYSIPNAKTSKVVKQHQHHKHHQQPKESPISPSSINENKNNEECNNSNSNSTPIQFNRRTFLASTTAATVLMVGATAEALPSNNNEKLPSLLTSSSATGATTGTTPLTFEQVMAKASKKALSGGKAGASASIVQVLSLMWLRTSMNYQYRYGGSLSTSLDTLYKEGGVPRLYQGLPFALVQGPLTRFGDTAANVGILVLLDSLAFTEGMPLPLRTLCASITAGAWRIFLMPIDTSKTVMQVEGKEGLTNLYDTVKENGPGPLYRGAFASAAATTVGHFPWFLTYNYLNEVLPLVEGNAEKDSMIIFLNLARSAFLGLAASCVSDCCSNSLRVIKTTKQTATLDSIEEIGLNASTSANVKGTSANVKGSSKGENEETKKDSEISYSDAVKLILETDGWVGLFGRGLKTRLLTNAIQGAAFSVLWRYFQQVGN